MHTHTIVSCLRPSPTSQATDCSVYPKMAKHFVISALSMGVFYALVLLLTCCLPSQNAGASTVVTTIFEGSTHHLISLFWWIFIGTTGVSAIALLLALVTGREYDKK